MYPTLGIAATRFPSCMLKGVDQNTPSERQSLSRGYNCLKCLRIYSFCIVSLVVVPMYRILIVFGRPSVFCVSLRSYVIRENGQFNVLPGRLCFTVILH